MNRRLILVLGWLGATLVSGSVAWAAVGFVRDSVTDRPSELVADAVAQVTAASTDTSGGVVPTSGIDPSTTDAPAIGVTDPGAGSTTTVVTTTLPQATTSTTTTTEAPSDEWQTKTYTLNGGAVSIRYRPGEVRLKGAVPSPGFRVDVKNDGPTEVEVAFEGEDTESEFRARWRAGELDVEIKSDD